MKITLELELHSHELLPLSSSNPYSRDYRVTWKVIDHDFTLPEDLPEGTDAIIHRIEPVRITRSFAPVTSWEGTL